MTGRRPPRLPRWPSASVTTGTAPVVPPLPDGPAVIVHVERAQGPDGKDYSAALAQEIARLLTTPRSPR